jgi:hypothetical protein
MVLVVVALLPTSRTATLLSSQLTTPVAMALSMIVEITSETPRFTLRYAAMLAHSPPATIATMMATMIFSQPGSQAWPANTAAANTATRYWPSTPMLNRFIRKPMATATADR